MKTITVIGAGTMGNGIAHVFAINGYQTNLVDISQVALAKAHQTITKNLDRQIKKGNISDSQKAQALTNLNTSVDMTQVIPTSDLIIEAASENFDIKASIFKQIDQLAPDTAFLATNTSSISITKIAAQTNRPDKVIGMHFMNPVPVMKLVEIIRGYSTSDQTAEAITELSQNIGKTPVLAQDYPGFVANRILMPMINEAIYTLFEGVAGVREIDTVMKLGMAHPMGPLRLADFIGLDVCLAILNVLYQGFGNSKYAPCPLLVNMVQAGNLGVKTNVGFYDYSADFKNPNLAHQFR